MSVDERAILERPTRLFKYIADRTEWGHRALGRLSRRGSITIEVDGEPVREISPRELVFEGDVVRVEGRAVAGARPGASDHWVLNKPEDVISTASDTRDRPDLAPWLERIGPRAFPVGRLDRETTGLLLMIDDGDLAYMLLHPDFHARKRYVLTITGDVSPEDSRLVMMLEGVDIGAKGGVLARAESAAVFERGPERSIVHVELTEGRKRQVRRMCRHVRFRLEHLHRDRFGPVHLGDVAPGELRRLGEGEIDALWGCVGGRAVPGERADAALVRHAAFLRERDEPNARLESWLTARGLWGE